MTSPDGTLLIDVTRDFETQARALARVDLALITHAHRDASGGLAALDRWSRADVPVLASRATVATLAARHRRLVHVELRAASAGRAVDWRGWRLTPRLVPHARDCPTFAWRLQRGDVAVVYASDVARLTPGLAALAAGCDLLVLDGAMWRRRIFTHLEIQSTVPIVARWQVQRVLFTQLGRSTPEHDQLDRWLRAYDARFGAAYDGLEVRLDS